MVDNPRQVVRAAIKSQVLTGTYPLQANKHKMKKAQTSNCPLCKTGHIEDITHFLLTCATLEDTRRNYMSRINKIIPKDLKIPLIEALADTRTLKNAHPHVNIRGIEQVTRDFIFAMHLQRTQILRP